ncbi:MAG: hypothetical protein V3S56_02285 [Gemmatimonadota bacterium]
MRHVLNPLFLLLVFAGCTAGDAPLTDDVPADDEPGIVEVVARGLSFEAPDSIPSGWTTFRFQNASPLTHFVIIERLPEGTSIVELEKDVSPVFQDAMDLINEGRASEGFAQFERLPEWFGEVEYWGGPGFLGPGMTGQTTVHLTPGTYVLECYVKTAGRFHSADGMLAQLIVTDEPSNVPEPASTITLTLSNAGIDVQGSLVSGLNTVKVEFAEQMVHENMLEHDVHLVRLNEGTDTADVDAWMNWVETSGLETPAPAEFLGGTHEMPAGEVAYFTVDLSPGSYAWVAEVPSPLEKGMLVTFTVE